MPKNEPECPNCGRDVDESVVGLSCPSCHHRIDRYDAYYG